MATRNVRTLIVLGDNLKRCEVKAIQDVMDAVEEHTKHKWRVRGYNTLTKSSRNASLDWLKHRFEQEEDK